MPGLVVGPGAADCSPPAPKGPVGLESGSLMGTMAGADGFSTEEAA